MNLRMSLIDCGSKPNLLDNIATLACSCNILLSSCLETKRGTYKSWMHPIWMGRMDGMGRLYITCVTLDVPRGGTTGKLLVIQNGDSVLYLWYLRFLWFQPGAWYLVPVHT